MLIAMAVHDTLTNHRTGKTKRTLWSLAETVNFDRHRLIVIDNGSCEATQTVFREAAHELNFAVLGTGGVNLGTAKAINLAIRKRAPGEHVVKLDNDVVFHQRGWASLMVRVFDRDPEIGVCGLKRRDVDASPDNPDEPSTLRMLPHELGQRWIVTEEVKHVMGTCVAISSALLDRIGYLWQPGVYGFDDADLSARAALAGFKRVYLPGVAIDHIDAGGDDYCQWKQDEAKRLFPEFNSRILLYEAGALDLYYDGK